MKIDPQTGRKKKFTKGLGTALFWFWAILLLTTSISMSAMTLRGNAYFTMAIPMYGVAGGLWFFLFIFGRRHHWKYLLAAWITGTAPALSLFLGPKTMLLVAVGTLFLDHRILLHKKNAVTNEEETAGGGMLVRGTKISDFRTLPKSYKTAKNESNDVITIGGIEIPREAEPSHFLLAGAPGVGKSTIISNMLEVVRNRNERACIYDPAGEFASRFYREGDIILNPLDARSAPWTPWADATSQADFEQIATGLIPDDERQPFFPQSARALLVTILSEAKTVQELVRYIMSSSNEELISMV